jgi:hypothetical protein
MTTEKSTRDIAEDISVEFGSEFELDRRDLTLAIEKALRDRDERAAAIATKKAETLRRAAHVVQQPTEEALRMAELAINTADDIASAIRGAIMSNRHYTETESVNAALLELREMFPDCQVSVDVSFPEYSSTKRYYIQVGENGQDFHAETLSKCMEMVRKWRKGKSQND